MRVNCFLLFVNCSCDYQVNKFVSRPVFVSPGQVVFGQLHSPNRLQAAIFLVTLASVICILFNLTPSGWQSAPTKFESIEQSASFQKIAGLGQVRFGEHLLVSKVATPWRWTRLQKLQSIRHLLDHTIERKQITQIFLKSTIKHLHLFCWMTFWWFVYSRAY